MDGPRRRPALWTEIGIKNSMTISYTTHISRFHTSITLQCIEKLSGRKIIFCWIKKNEFICDKDGIRFWANEWYPHAFQVFIEVLRPPFNHLTSVRQEAPIFIPAAFYAQHIAIVGCGELLLELSCFLGMAQQFQFLTLRFSPSGVFSTAVSDL